LLNSPEKMLFGIDNNSWKIGPKFMGIKLIPMGSHFVYYSLSDEDYAIKQGFCINVNSSTKVHIRKWDNDIQDFIHVKEEDKEGFTIGVNNFDFEPFLGSYPKENVENWNDVSNFISSKILSKLEPITRKYITTTNEYDDATTEDINTKANIFYTSINKIKFIHDKNQQNITNYYIDKSQQLSLILEKEYQGDYSMLLGEFQYSFITFILGEIFESFEQWKSLITLVLSCNEAISTNEEFYCYFIEVLYHQLRQLPKDFFADEITANNFMRRLLSQFILFCCEEKVSDKIYQRVIRLRKFLKVFFSFEIKNEVERILNIYKGVTSMNEYDDDDDLPVIVDESEIINFEKKYGNRKEMDNKMID